MPRRALSTILVLVLVLLLAAGLRLIAGGLPEPVVRDQILALRLHSVATGAVVGASLSVAGVLLQSLLRNPLASPDLLGLSSGAGLAVTLWVYLAFLAGSGVAYLGAVGTSALLGALASLAIVYTLSQRRGLLDPASLVLVGIIISIIASSASELVRQLMPDGGMAVQRILFADFRDVTTPRLVAVSAVLAGAIALGVVLGPAMDAAALGEDEAKSVGVPVGRLRLLLFVASGVLAGGAVMLAGSVGFVGLLCPHIVRKAAGPAHRPLVLGSAFSGAALVILADALVAAVKQLNTGAGRLPLGVLTALVGGPVLILLLRQRHRGEA